MAALNRAEQVRALIAAHHEDMQNTSFSQALDQGRLARRIESKDFGKGGKRDKLMIDATNGPDMSASEGAPRARAGAPFALVSMNPDSMLKTAFSDGYMHSAVVLPTAEHIQSFHNLMEQDDLTNAHRIQLRSAFTRPVAIYHGDAATSKREGKGPHGEWGTVAGDDVGKAVLSDRTVVARGLASSGSYMYPEIRAKALPVVKGKEDLHNEAVVRVRQGAKFHSFNTVGRASDMTARQFALAADQSLANKRKSKCSIM